MVRSDLCVFPAKTRRTHSISWCTNGWLRGLAMKERIALFTVFSLLLPPPMPRAAAQTPAAKPATPATQTAPPAKPATTAAKPAAPAPPQPPDPDGGWPRNYTTKSGAALVVYQPQIASWDNQTHAVAFAAVSYALPGAEKPAMGTIKLEANTRVAVSDRLVSFTDFAITESNFPTLSRDQVRTAVEELTNGIPKDERVIALDRVLASIDKSQIIPKNVEGRKADPPTIFYSTTPAILINLDGDPIWSPIKENDLKFAVNTNWDLFQHEPTNTFYLRNGQNWLQASAYTGPWKAAGDLPGSFAKLPKDDQNWNEVRAAVPGKKLSADKAPKVFVSTQPSELILLTGAPNYLVVGSTQLLWVSNTLSDLFRLGKTGLVYYLVAGRWFSAPDFTGPWTFASQNMPEEFKKIPLEHERSRVLASVPGTTQAAEAVLLAQIPQTARVNKKTVKAPEVVYQGDPKFEPIDKTTVSRAVNTDKDIIKVGDLYYMCFQGVWFMSKTATGPWEVTGSVPKQIYEIPTSSPSHNVTYVTVVEEDDDDVEFA